MLQGVTITNLGHATFLFTTAEGKTILLDPWLKGNAWCPEAFHDVASDAILITHGHNDHIGDIFTAAENCRGSIVGIFDLTTWLGFQGVDKSKLLGMGKGGTIELPGLGVKVSMTHACHSSSFTDDDKITFLGAAVGYVIHFDGIRIYVAGDTDVFGDMALIKELYAPDVALLPIGDHFTMNTKAAAIACRLLGVKTVIPFHFGTFPMLKGSPEELAEELAALSLDVKVMYCEPGESLT